MGVVVKCDAALFLPCTAGIQAFTTDDETKQGSPVLICNRAVFPRYCSMYTILEIAVTIPNQCLYSNLQ
ncbi:uncharacterized protein FPRO_00499 [Fusarium proliferatum ET1]|uniref:Uncharacterized protein n=1 Tax=Fusarium proliferatum (strain ET1) TaxID=1227346 RepID=A0A1L7V3A9_FUSPR|nr:uncharacterized protein FPRO_00499 [Fusarium proliferatum ET1]CZR35378.1 uncharacterized protein FPRO_00499 [Fusarium proliferatum ET1]